MTSENVNVELPKFISQNWMMKQAILIGRWPSAESKGKGTKVKSTMIDIEIIVKSEMITRERRMTIERCEIVYST